METAILKDINPNYSVNSDGVVTNIRTGKQLKFFQDRCGYLVCRIHNTNGIRVGVKPHRLVAKYFLENTSNEARDVNHINGIKTDNRVENLEWITRRGNVSHHRKLIEELIREKDALVAEIELLKRKRNQLLVT